MTDTILNRPLRIFLCHASDDKPAVRDLYRRLCSDGFEPWLDEENLLPGQKWRDEIPQAVRESDITLVCLSQHSINKAGYVQKEIVFALDVADEQPEGAIFLIPLRLEECTVPERLSHLQWVNLYDEGGYGHLLLALRKRAADLNIPAGPTPSSSSVPPSSPTASGTLPSEGNSNVSGGVTVTGEQVEVGNDVVGRDKIVHAATYIEHATIIQSSSSLPGEDSRGLVVKTEPALNGIGKAARVPPSHVVPEVYIHTFDALPDIPAGAMLLDWSKHFSRATTPRQVPTLAAWQTELLPELERLREQLGRRDLIRVHSTAALSAGFAFGHAFTTRGYYHLEVSQRSGDTNETWRSDAVAQTGDNVPEFRQKELVGDPTQPEALAVIYASKTQPLEKVLGDIGRCWGDTEALQRLSGEGYLEYNIPAIFDLLQEGFSNEDLRTLAFRVPALKPVYNNLASGMATSEIVRQIVEYADKHLVLEPVLSEIQRQNPRRYQQAATRLRALARSAAFQRVLLLETEIASKGRRLITGWEAAELARLSQPQLSRFVSTLRRPVHIKLCLTVPFGLAVFMGHQWNGIGHNVHVYEYVGGDTPYAPACELGV